MKRGDYVRTKNYGIAKILNIYNSTTTNYSSIILDKIDNFGRLGVNITLDDIIGNPSKKPIDLIEAGDYVNGERIEFITNKGQLLTEYGYDLFEQYENIKSIVTKEQVESMEYKIGE